VEIAKDHHSQAPDRRHTALHKANLTKPWPAGGYKQQVSDVVHHCANCEAAQASSRWKPRHPALASPRRIGSRNTKPRNCAFLFYTACSVHSRSTPLLWLCLEAEKKSVVAPEYSWNPERPATRSAQILFLGTCTSYRGEAWCFYKLPRPTPTPSCRTAQLPVQV
jgi:hypothetical protein